jgi:plasmid maintenance system antidote protein VapI
MQWQDGISPDMAMKLSKTLGGQPQFRLTLQNNREVTALKLTIGIQEEIDSLYPEIEKQTLPLPRLSKT